MSRPDGIAECGDSQSATAPAALASLSEAQCRVLDVALATRVVEVQVSDDDDDHRSNRHHSGRGHTVKQTQYRWVYAAEVVGGPPSQNATDNTVGALYLNVGWTNSEQKQQLPVNSTVKCTVPTDASTRVQFGPLRSSDGVFDKYAALLDVTLADLRAQYQRFLGGVIALSIGVVLLFGSFLLFLLSACCCRTILMVPDVQYERLSFADASSPTYGGGAGKQGKF